MHSWTNMDSATLPMLPHCNYLKASWMTEAVRETIYHSLIINHFLATTKKSFINCTSNEFVNYTTIRNGSSASRRRERWSRRNRGIVTRFLAKSVRFLAWKLSIFSSFSIYHEFVCCSVTFSRVHATLWHALSVGRSVRLSRLVFFVNILHHFTSF